MDYCKTVERECVHCQTGNCPYRISQNTEQDEIMKHYAFDKYQKYAMRTANPTCKTLPNAALGLTGEAGEVADFIKKYLYQGHEFDGERIKKELGDVLWYIALMCEVINTSIDEVAEINIRKLVERYPNGFNFKDSRERIEDEAARGSNDESDDVASQAERSETGHR